MSSTTTSIFSFDHGQKKMSRAIGVTEEFLEDLQDQVRDVIKDTLFDEDRNIKDDISPSMLVSNIKLPSNIFFKYFIKVYIKNTSGILDVCYYF